MSKSILTVGFQLAVEGPRFEWFDSKVSLLDYDIVLIHPTFGEYITTYTGTYRGRPCLNDDTSFAVIEACEHWRREIVDAVALGKTVMVFLPEATDIYVATGSQSTSGTGRNQKVTRHVNILSNYRAIPAPTDPTSSSGSAMKLSPRFSEAFSEYWSEFASQSTYKVLLGEKIKEVAITTKVGDKAAGAVLRSTTSSGVLALLPELKFDQPGFITSERKYTKKAVAFAGRLISAVIKLDKSLREGCEKSVKPDWASAELYSTLEETQLKSDLLRAEDRVIVAQREKDAIKLKAAAAESLRGLLYEKGTQLEKAIIEALTLLGFAAKGYKDAGSEFDVIFESAEGRLLGEAEGKDNKAINIEKLRQLSMNIHEDLARPEVEKPAKGVLFGNGYRLVAPSGRECQFTDKCIQASQLSSTALVTTTDLFAVAKFTKDSADQVFAQKCRECLLSQFGIVAFPPLPVETTPPEVFTEDTTEKDKATLPMGQN